VEEEIRQIRRQFKQRESPLKDYYKDCEMEDLEIDYSQEARRQREKIEKK